MKSINRKIFEIKKHIGKVSKDSTNPFFNSKYFDINKLLEMVEPLLEERDLYIIQPITDGCVVSSIVDVETGESITSSIPLPLINDPQKIGSAITYYRRYSLVSLLCIQAEDDDGNRASKKEPEMLTDDQFKAALKSDIKGISATLKSFDTDTRRMTTSQKKALTQKLHVLETAERLDDELDMQIELPK